MSRLLLVKDKVGLKKSVNTVLKNSDVLDSEAVIFISNLKKEAREIYLVGGCIRNILHNEPIRDIDLIVVIDSSKRESLSSLFPRKVVSNRLKGYKLIFDAIQIDVWPIEENWASKNGLIAKKYQLTREISKGAFYNFDAITYSLKSNILDCYFYNQCILKNELDIILHDRKYISSNPNKIANVLRAFYLMDRYGFNLSYKLCLYIDQQIEYYKTMNNDIVALFNSCLEKYPKYYPFLNRKKLSGLLNLSYAIKS
jgi:hypothetical protein